MLLYCLLFVMFSIVVYAISIVNGVFSQVRDSEYDVKEGLKSKWYAFAWTNWYIYLLLYPSILYILSSIFGLVLIFAIFYGVFVIRKLQNIEKW